MDILHFKKLVRNRQEQAANDAALFIQHNNEIDEGKGKFTLKKVLLVCF